MNEKRANEQRATIATLPFSAMSDTQILSELKRYQIGLSVEEARTIERLLGRAPTVVEAVIWGIQGSEHCSYKSSRRFLAMLPTEGKHVILGPKEDSGIVAITDGPPGKRWGLVISHESHNHPSQIVPFEGAATGVGGTVRDVACMGARVVGCLDMLRLGDLKSRESRTIAKEVIRGIAGYANPLGLPNLGGDTMFDASYNSNCLVNAIAVGICREDEIIHSTVPAEAARDRYDIIIVGKPTDRSGFGGAAFASATLEEEKKDQNTGAVQEPNPFLERHLLASTYALFDWLVREGHLGKVSFKDLGAGGVVCASVEQIAERGFGADIDLSRVHTAATDLPPEVIACAETQERFCWICHPSLTERILAHYNTDWDLPSVAEGARASCIGSVNASGVYRLHMLGRTVCEAKSKDITSGLRYERPTVRVQGGKPEPQIACKDDTVTITSPAPLETSLLTIFIALLAHRNGCSREHCVTRRYDKDVIGMTQVEAGEADAGVILPLQDLQSFEVGGTHPGWTLNPEEKCTGVAFGGGGNGRIGRISAYTQGASATVEAMCNAAAVGAEPRALTDCLNYGNPEIPTHLGALQDGTCGIADAARGVLIDGSPVPVISGNVSLYNSLPNGNAIDPTAIVCCIGVLKDGRKALTKQIRKPGLALFLLGERQDACGGSLYYDVLEDMTGAQRDAFLGTNVPKLDFGKISRMIRCVTESAQAGLLHACHDISEGGLMLALLEMTALVRKIGGGIGLRADIGSLGSLRSDAILFTETPGFILAAEPENERALRSVAERSGVELQPLGRSIQGDEFAISRNDRMLLRSRLTPLLHTWESSLEHIFGGERI